VDEVTQPAALVLGALVAVASLALCCLFAAVATVLCRQRRSNRPRGQVAIKPPAPEEEKPSVELSVISAPATVRPHRHLTTQRRSQVEVVDGCQHEALLAKEAHGHCAVHPQLPQDVCGTWRRSKEIPRIGKCRSFTSFQ